LQASGALTAMQVAQKAAAVITNSKGISASFIVSGNGINTKGIIKSIGQKFSVVMPQVSTWYNGKALYTYNPRTAETTVSTPDARELLESNPLLYVKGGSVGYTCRFSAVRCNGRYVVDLFPRDKRTAIKKLTFTINASNFHTEKIVVDTGGNITTINVTSLKTGVKLQSSEFEYPKARYPKVEIVDLR